MSAIDRETIQLLMHSLTINLSSASFREQHLDMLDQYRDFVASNSDPNLDLHTLHSLQYDNIPFPLPRRK